MKDRLFALLLMGVAIVGLFAMGEVWRTHQLLAMDSKQSQMSNPAPVTPVQCADSGGQHLNFSTTTNSYSCGSTTSYSPLTGTTGSIGGSLLALGGTTSGTVTISGANPGEPCDAVPSDGTNMWASGVTVGCTVTASNTVTVTLYAIISLTPPSKQYNVRVFP